LCRGADRFLVYYLWVVAAVKASGVRLMPGCSR
jgi:hypothetical protein